MEENPNELTEEIQSLPAESSVQPEEAPASNTKYVIISVVVVLVVLALIVLATIYLANPENSQTTEQIRDIVIIFMALVGLVIGVALVILIVQLSTLINLLQNEIRPIINSTNETVNTLKGTAQFVSNNLTEPVIKMNQLMAMIRQLFSLRKR
jgi:heme/copper-type cytochrome/quinol oxidase subunit 2